MTVYNPFTGLKRKLPVRRCNVWHRGIKSISSKAFTFLMRVQERFCFHLHAYASNHVLLAVLVSLRHLNKLKSNLLDRVIFAAIGCCCYHINAARRLLSIDSFVGDMQPYQDNHRYFQIRQRFHRIDDFVDDAHARIITNFTTTELRQLLHRFDVPTSEDGYVRVPYHTTAANKVWSYKFHPEELLLYTLIKVKEGDSHVKMAKSTFGGTDGGRRWSYGYKWYLRFVTHKYRNLIGVEGLRRWVPKFPEFAEAIRQHISKPKLYLPDDEDAYVLPSVPFPIGDFNIALFFDGVFFPTSKPLSGPNGDYIGSTRIIGHMLGQQAIYGHKGHGVTMLSFMMPNGIHVWYGPVSARRNENNILLWSGIDEMLYEIQSTVSDDLYCAYGDQIFQNNVYRCIKICHQTRPFTDRQRAENRVLNRARVSIEWDYGVMKTLFRESINRDSKKFVKDTEQIINELQFEGLLKNCYCCFNGNAGSATRSFNLLSPTIDQYLYEVPDPVPNPQSPQEYLNIVNDPLYDPST